MARGILLLQGSPRRKGNTSRLASAFERGAREAGCEVVRFDVAHMDIAGCRGCHACWKNGGACVLDDDMSQIYPYLDEFDTIALATPDSGTIEPVLALYRKVASYLGWRDEGVVAVPHMDGPSDIEGNDALEAAYALGKSLG